MIGCAPISRLMTIIVGRVPLTRRFPWNPFPVKPGKTKR